VYGKTNAQTAEAAFQLRDAGYQNVAEPVDGLKAWKTAQYPIKGG